MSIKRYATLGSLSLFLFFTGCANMSTAEQRTLSGAAIGAAVGTGIGAVTGNNALGGAAIGAVTGAAAGYLYDQHEKHKHKH